MFCTDQMTKPVKWVTCNIIQKKGDEIAKKKKKKKQRETEEK